MYSHFLKRFFDLCYSFLLLLFLSPVILVISLLLWAKAGRPIFFTQVRPGRGEEPFRMYKFRTMLPPPDLAIDPLSDEGRVFPFGSMLRRTSLDELPELINVVKGEMSLVGPRPLLVRYLPFYTDLERKRFQVRPGITGLAQISGRNNSPWDDRLALDIKYVAQIGFFRDLKILFQTVSKVLGSKDVQVTPSSTMLNLDQERATQHGKIVNDLSSGLHASERHKISS